MAEATAPVPPTAAPAASTPSAGGGGTAAAGAHGELLSGSAQQAIADQLAALYLALVAFYEACRSPAVWASTRKAAKPILIAAVCQYIALRALLIPVNLVLRLISLLTATPLLTFSSHQLVTYSLGIYPFITVLLTRYVYKRLLSDCFFASLSEVNPREARRLASTDPEQSRTLRERFVALATDDADDPWRMLLLMLVLSMLRSWRWVRLGPLGYIVIPIAEWLSIRYLVGNPWAAGLAAAIVVLAPPLAPVAMDAVELWASSRALGQSSMRHFLSRAIPKQRRAAFVKTFEGTVVTYFVFPALAMRLPVGSLRPLLGPLLVFPAAAVAARCVHDITTRGATGRTVDALRSS